MFRALVCLTVVVPGMDPLDGSAMFVHKAPSSDLACCTTFMLVHPAWAFWSRWTIELIVMVSQSMYMLITSSGRNKFLQRLKDSFTGHESCFLSSSNF